MRCGGSRPACLSSSGGASDSIITIMNITFIGSDRSSRNAHIVCLSGFCLSGSDLQVLTTLLKEHLESGSRSLKYLVLLMIMILIILFIGSGDPCAG